MRYARKFKKILAPTYLATAGLLWANNVYAFSPLSFTGSPTVNGSGGAGTTALWTNVGQVNGVDIDMVIYIVSNNQSTVSLATSGDNALVRLDGAADQEVNLEYRFYRTGTFNTPSEEFITVIPRVLYADIDLAATETVRITEAQVASYTVENPTDLTVSQPASELIITSAADGNGTSTNIAIRFDLQPTTAIAVTFSKTGSGGRNFEFDGNIDFSFSNPNTTDLDTTPPATPTVNSLSTNDATPTLTGSAEAFSTVAVTVGGATFEVFATSVGEWTLDTGAETPVSGSFNPDINGTNEVAVTSTDAAGNSSSDATSNELTIDTTAPTVPTVTSLTTNNTTPVITGTSEIGTTVSVTVAGATYAPTVDGGGNWSIDTSSDTPTSGSFSPNVNGANEVTVTSTDAVGNASSDATSNELTIDTTAPATPTVASQITNDPTPVITGTAEADSTVTVTVGGATYTTTATGGTWSIDTGSDTPTSGSFSPNVNGINEVAVTSTDAAGNNASDASSNELIIDTTAPNVPTVTSQTTNDPTPVIAGTAEAGSTVTVTMGGATYTATATGGGTWSIDTGSDSPTSGSFSPNINGTNEVAITSTDDAGNSTNDVTSNELTIDTTAPAVPTVTSQTTNDPTPVIAGTAETGSTVTVTVAGATYTTAATGGTWSIDTGNDTPTSGSFSPNVNGTNEVAITSTDDAGNSTSDVTSNELTIDTTAPTTPTVTSQITNDPTPAIVGTAETGTTLTVTVAGATYAPTVDGGGNWSIDTSSDSPTSGSFAPDVNGINEVVVTSTDAVGNSTSDVTSNELTIDTTAPAVPIVTSQTTNDPTPVIAGTAEAGSTVTVTVAGATYTTTATGGTWSIDTGSDTPTSGTFSPNVNGMNEVAITSTDDAGNSSSDATNNELTIDTTLPSITVTNPPVANQANAASYSVSGTCTVADGDLTVSIAGATPASQTVSCSGGTWSAVFDVGAVADGFATIAINASQTDAAGNLATANQSADKDTVAPAIAIDDNGSNGDAIYNAAEDDAVTVSGTTTAEPGQTVTVRLDDGTITVSVTATVQPDNRWTATPADISGLSNGPLTLTADVDDAAGNPATQAVDSVALDNTAAFITAVNVGPTNDTTPTLSGTTDQPAGRTVVITDHLDVTLCTTTVSAATPDNSWACTPSTPLSEGAHTLTATIDDGAGNIATVSFTATIDLDADNDGIPDVAEGDSDSDHDGIPDYLDTDSDNDGIPDVDENTNLPPLTGNDSDGDRIDDAIDVDLTGGIDADGNGIDDAFQPSDTDGDGLPDHLDGDADNDGIPDIVEGSADTDLDGLADFQDSDADNDGIPDGIEERALPPLSGSDADVDGIDDAIDADATGGSDINFNGIDDAFEPQDSDNDGTADHLDADADNDGVPDAVEAANLPALTGNDSDLDGIDDALDVDLTGGNDANGDGIDDTLAPSDSDRDGIPDMIDTDSDNDGIHDTVEGGAANSDTDFDGIDDAFDIDQTGGVDADNDGVDDRGALDSDNDGIANFQDLDSDNDGRSDVSEAGLPDHNGDGFADDGATTDAPLNSDGTDLPDYLDLDSDNNGVNDIVNTPARRFDGDGDGRIDFSFADDSDADGVPDVIDGEAETAGIGADSDGDGVPNSLDADDDNDGVPDEVEAALGIDTDSDGDGLVDRLDLDSDNDGLPDSIERDVDAGLDTDADGVIDTIIDLDFDGLADIIPKGLNPIDSDGDGTADYIDIDSDNDGLTDLSESAPDSSDLDRDGDGRLDATTDMDGDGLLDIVDTAVVGGISGRAFRRLDLDNDGLANHLDTDSDGDGLTDAQENGDFNNDGIADALQNQGEINTAVSGTGSWGPLSVMALALMALFTRRRANAAMPGLILTGLAISLSLSDAAHADTRCGQYSWHDPARGETVLTDPQHPQAERTFHDCTYVVLGIGASHVDPEGEANGWSTADDSSTGYHITLGYQPHPHWFMELGYLDAGEATLGHANPSVTGDPTVTYDVPSIFVGYWLRRPSAAINLYGKAGASAIITDTSDERVPFEENTSMQLAFGIGLQWRFASRWFARVQHDSFDRDINYTGVAIGAFIGSGAAPRDSK